MVNSSPDLLEENNSYSINSLTPAIVEETIHMDEKQPKLASSELSLYLTIERQHANKNFTCIANHKSFDDSSDDNTVNSKRLKKIVKFDVQYEPEIELLKNITMPAQENNPISFYCKAHARPMNNLKYRWFIDNQLISNANKPELRIEKLTRQLHLRRIGCEVTNEIGTSLKEMTLAVLYSPAYVTHLLPPSLQPAMPNEQLNSFTILSNNKKTNLLNQQQNSKLISSNKQINRDNDFLIPSASMMALAKELAIGYDVGQELELRCDFDSNPELQDVIWYKISTDYDVMQDVTPNDADELIAFGAGHAIFKKPFLLSSQQQNNLAKGSNIVSVGNELEHDNNEHEHEHHNHNNNKRHIQSTFFNQMNNAAHDNDNDNQLEELNYEQMSEELLAEMDRLQKIDNSTIILLNDVAASSNKLALNQQQHQHRKLESLSSPILRQTNPHIFEPLKWVVFKQQSSNIRKISSTSININQDLEKHLEQQFTLISLMKPALISNVNNLKNFSKSSKLYQRKTQISSSTYTIKSAQEDAMGRYVCKSKSQSESIQPTIARSIYLIARKRPRIISVKQQFTTVEQYLEGKIQIECLITINTVLETVIEWSKDGKVIIYYPLTNDDISINQNQRKNLILTFLTYSLNNHDLYYIYIVDSSQR